ncbi:MAG: nucleotidyltransferase domain-containing protein [Prolixibacteraceae bacterium]|nr:nucleotidyltransferase domain-containing protein [Prolixibacteraceae bacterium]
MNNNKIIEQIKSTVNKVEPKATVILFGSHARGDYNKNSDIDLLVLVDKEIITRTDQKNIKYPLYDIEIETGTIISPLIYSKNDWENIHRKTPFYENVSNEGVEL